MFFSSLGLFFVAGIGFVDALAPKPKTPTAIATVTPCPSVSAHNIPAPVITVTNQYQPVSTCIPKSEVCVKNKCWTRYSYSTYDFVSTVIPCPFAVPSQTTTITKTEQSVLVSRSSKTITNEYITSTVTRKWRRPTTVTSTASKYTTIINEWSAAYKDLGPYAIPGYSGSGICTKCQGPNKQKVQLLDVIECTQGSDIPTTCNQHPEVWVFGDTPNSARTASAVCSTRTSVSAPGIYIFKFPQNEPPATIRVPPQTITYTVPGSGGRVQTRTHTIAETTTIFPSRQWTATVTRECARPTEISFNIIVKKVIYYVIPPFTYPDGP